MKSKLTLFAALTALLFVFAVNDAFASKTHMNSLGLSPEVNSEGNATGMPGAEMMITFDTVHWNINPATLGFALPLVAASWDIYKNTNGAGLAVIKPMENLWIEISSEYSSSSYTNVELDDPTQPGKANFWNFGEANATDSYWTRNGAAILIAGGQATMDVLAGSITNTVPPTFAVMMSSITMAYKIKDLIVGAQIGFGYTGTGLGEDNFGEVYEPQIKLGVFVPFSKSMNMDLAVHLNFPIVNQEYKDLFTYQSVNSYDITAYARFNWFVSEMHRLHFFGRYTAKDHTTEYATERSGLDETHTFYRMGHQLQFGISDEMVINKNALAFVGADVVMDRTENRYVGKVEGWNMPSYRMDQTKWQGTIRMGAEGVILATIQGRLGVNHKFLVYDFDNGTQGTPGLDSKGNKNINYSNAAFFGLGMKFGPMVFEFNIDKTIFTQAGGAEQLAMDVTFIYLIPEPVAPAAETNEEK